MHRAKVMGGVLLAAATLAFSAPAAAATQSQWKLVDLGAATAPSAVNNLGVVVGCFTGADSATHAFAYRDGAMQDLGPGCADAVNDNGVIAGALNGEIVEWIGRAVTHTGVQGAVVAMNNGGALIGVAHDAGTTSPRYFLYRDGSVTNLGFSAMGINDAGVIVGQSNASAVVYQNGTLTPIGAPNATNATDINRAGTIAGLAQGPSGPSPFLYDGTIHLVGPSYADAVALNNANQVVGTEEGGYGYVFDGTGTTLLVNIPAVAALGWRRLEPVDINDAGWIVGTATTPSYEQHGFVLVPEASTNVALASNGATAIASSQYSAAYPASAAINGDATGAGWSNGGGWADGTAGQYPDWIEVDFAQASQIDRVVVYTLQDNWQSPSQPTDQMTFTQYGVTAFDVQAWNGSAWQTLSSISGNNRVKRTVTFPAVTTSKIRIVVNAALNSLSRITEIEAWTGTGTTSSDSNVALASAGATASASTEYSADYPVRAIIDGDPTGAGWSHGGGWADGTYGQFPDWVQVNFPVPEKLSQVVVYTLQDSWQNPSVPTDAMTFSQYGVTDFDVQGWDGTQWVALASITGNNQVKRSVAIDAFTTTQIRIVVKGALNGYSRITEVEAWGAPAATTATGMTNWALASNGGVASASSQYDGAYPVSAVIDGERAGAHWSAGGGWADGTPDQYPDWVEVDFNGTKKLNAIDVYTVQDDWQNPVEPTASMTFTRYGITDFQVQAWDGFQWQTVASVSGNNLVKRSIPLLVTTSKIRINVTGALYSLSRITEIEAWGN